MPKITTQKQPKKQQQQHTELKESGKQKTYSKNIFELLKSLNKTTQNCNWLENFSQTENLISVSLFFQVFWRSWILEWEPPSHGMGLTFRWRWRKLRLVGCYNWPQDLAARCLWGTLTGVAGFHHPVGTQGFHVNHQVSGLYFRYFSCYLNDIKVYEPAGNSTVTVQVAARCYRSMRKNEAPAFRLSWTDTAGEKITEFYCSCKAG